MKDLKVGDYGRFEFVLQRKGLITSFSLCATVKEIDGKYVLLTDNDDIEYLPKKADISSFHKEKPFTR